MDADDVAFPQRLQVQHDYMEANPDILASGSDFICYGKPHGRGQRGIAMTPEQVRMALIDNNCFLHPSLIIRYAVMKEIGGYDERYAYSADYDLMCRLILHGKVVNMPDVLMQYRRHPAQISQKHWTVQQEYANETSRI